MTPALLLASILVGPQDTVTVSLADAVALGVRHSPVIAAARAAAAAPRGELAESRLPFLGPVLVEFSRLERRAPGTPATWDRNVAIRQGIDISGSSFARAQAARLRLDAVDARVEDAVRGVTVDVHVAFVALSLADERTVLLDSAAALAERLATVARRRLEAGETTLLDANAALLEAARGRSAALRARAAREESAAALGELLAIPAGAVLRTGGLPPLPPALTASDRTLEALAQSRRPDLHAAMLDVASAERDGAAARRMQLPSLELGWNWGREASTDRLGGMTVGLRVPLLQRHQAARGAASAANAVAAATQVGVERQVTTEVRTAASRYRSAHEAATRFASEVLRAAEENVTLSDRAVQEGELGIPDAMLLRSLAVAARLEYLEALRDAFAAWYALAAALAMAPDGIPLLVGGAR